MGILNIAGMIEVRLRQVLPLVLIWFWCDLPVAQGAPVLRHERLFGATESFRRVEIFGRNAGSRCRDRIGVPERCSMGSEPVRKPGIVVAARGPAVAAAERGSRHGGCTVKRFSPL